MKNICFYFQVHQPFRLRRYRFFDIGNDSYYYDDYLNESIANRVAQKCYIPTNQVLLNAIKKHNGSFKVAFSISGVALEQFKLYTPEVIKSFQKLAKTGCVEFLSETYSHSLVALKDKREFSKQVQMHSDMIFELFGQRPTVFRNTELIYSDGIGEMVASLGYKAMVTEGAKQILGWKSPNFLYCNVINPKLKVLLKNYKLSDDIAFRFGNKNWSEYPLTVDKYASWIKALDSKEEIINLFMDYETFGEHQWKDTGIFEFLEDLPQAMLNEGFSFVTPSESIEKLQPVSAIKIHHPISWADEERDLTAWLGNELQDEAFNNLYALLPQIEKCTDAKILKDWMFLQTSDHFYYMSTKYFSDGDVHAYFNPYETPYQAFSNYMNVLSDFSIRLKASVPYENDQRVFELHSKLDESQKLIESLKQEIAILTAKK